MSTPELVTYWSLGRFDRESLPEGLLRDHRLKDGTWGRLALLSGRITLVWDDGEGGERDLQPGETIMIPPKRPHHLVVGGPFELQLDFQREKLPGEGMEAAS